VAGVKTALTCPQKLIGGFKLKNKKSTMYMGVYVESESRFLSLSQSKPENVSSQSELSLRATIQLNRFFRYTHSTINALNIF
jgi:hypothetical protein